MGLSDFQYEIKENKKCVTLNYSHCVITQDTKISKLRMRKVND